MATFPDCRACADYIAPLRFDAESARCHECGRSVIAFAELVLPQILHRAFPIPESVCRENTIVISGAVGNFLIFGRALDSENLFDLAGTLSYISHYDVAFAHMEDVLIKKHIEELFSP
jgi:hypothetical protein